MPDVPCPSFEPNSGCSVWCNEELDCCVVCCRRHKCLWIEGKICPKAKKILELPEWKNKIYSYEEKRPKSDLCKNCGRPAETGSQIWFVCPVNGNWHSVSDRCIFEVVKEKSISNRKQKI